MTQGYKLIGGITESDAFKDASAAELKVLLAVIELDGGDISGLDERLGITKARLTAALALWTEAGVIAPAEDIPTEGVEYEFKPRTLQVELDRADALSVARTVRDEGLRELYDELEMTLGCPTLNRDEIKRVSALITELGLTPEYILTYALHRAEKRRKKQQQSGDGAKVRPIYIGSVINEIKRLTDKGVTTLEELEIYLRKRDRENAATYEIGKEILGLDRVLSDEELEAFTRWSESYGFGAPIIKKAYSYTCGKQNKGYSLGYMDYVLTEWHKAGCRTVKDCENERKKNNEKYSSYKPAAKKEGEPKFVSYDAEDALMAALKRSYGEDI